MATSDSTPKFIEIQLTKGYIAIVDEYDADLALVKWEAHIGINGRVYARRKVMYKGKSTKVWMHKLIYCRSKGLLIPPEIVDHQDNNPLNNRRTNLREASHVENLQNAGVQKRQRARGILKGAHYHKRDRRWLSTINVNGKTIWLGSFATMEEAHEAYKKAAIKYFGEYANYE